MKPRSAATPGDRMLFIAAGKTNSIEGVERRIHPALKREGNPVLSSDRDREVMAILLGAVRM